MRLILIRHGQTPSNIKGLLDTAVPGPSLSGLGQRQAEALPAALAGEDIAALYASTATRAQQTAAPLARRRGLDLQVRDGLKEIQAGDLECADGEAEIMRYLQVLRGWMAGSYDIAMPNAESGAEALGRFDAVVQEAHGAGHSTVAMVSHGAMIRTWCAVRSVNVDPLHPERYALSNTGVVVVERAGTDQARPWRVASWTADPAGGETVTDRAHSGPEPVSEQTTG